MDPLLRHRAVRAARQALTAEKLLGIEAVPMGDAVLPMAEAPVATLTAPPAAPPGAIAPPVTPRHVPPPIAPPPARPAIAAPAAVASADQSLIGRTPLPAAPATLLPRDTKISLLQLMDENEVRPCSKCVLCESRTQTVFGEGDPDARIMFIGEGPGEVEDRTGRPFVGPAGELLMKMITAMGLSREKVFIANIVKCRPPGNRVPAPTEMLACQSYLFRQVQTVQPRVIVTLGGTATKHLLNTEKGITAIRGIWHTITTPVINDATLVHPIPVMPTFHPSYVLRAYTPENRKKVWNDLQQVMSLLQSVT